MMMLMLIYYKIRKSSDDNEVDGLKNECKNGDRIDDFMKHDQKELCVEVLL